jgi:hypothetical protein
MPASINLLPKDTTAGKDVARATGTMRKIVLSLGGIFLLVVLSGGAFYFFLFNNLNNLKARHEEVVREVESMQATEASLVLLKDRLQKSQSVLSARTNEGYFTKQRAFVASAPEGVRVRENQIDTSVSNIEIETPDARNIVSLLSSLLINSTFNSLLINKLSFSLATGYSVIFEVF